MGLFSKNFEKRGLFSKYFEKVPPPPGAAAPGGLKIVGYAGPFQLIQIAICCCLVQYSESQIHRTSIGTHRASQGLPARVGGRGCRGVSP